MALCFFSKTKLLSIFPKFGIANKSIYSTYREEQSERCEKVKFCIKSLKPTPPYGALPTITIVYNSIETKNKLFLDSGRFHGIQTPK
jgi:hypothetical protein